MLHENLGNMRSPMSGFIVSAVTSRSEGPGPVARSDRITYRLPVFGERFPSDESLRRTADSCMEGGLRLLVAFDLLVGVPEDIVLPVGAIVAYGLE